jgi:hypothetical protein
MNAQEILNKAAGHMEDRAATYDSEEGERSMGKTVEMFNTLYGTSLTEEQGWAFMAVLKMVRSSQGKYRADNYEDGVAYLSLMGESAGEAYICKTVQEHNHKCPECGVSEGRLHHLHCKHIE